MAVIVDLNVSKGKFDSPIRRLVAVRGTFLDMNAWRCSFNTLSNKHCFKILSFKN